MESELDSISKVNTLALTTYALALAGSRKSSKANAKLLRMQTYDKGTNNFSFMEQIMIEDRELIRIALAAHHQAFLIGSENSHHFPNLSVTIPKLSAISSLAFYGSSGSLLVTIASVLIAR